MNSLKKIALLFLGLTTIVPPLFADETIKNALIDIVYEAIDGKKIVIYDYQSPLFDPLQSKCKDLDDHTLFLDVQMITGSYTEYQLINLEEIEKLDSFQLFQTSLFDSTGFLAQYIDIFGEKNIALLQAPSQLFIRDYIPTVQGFTFVPIKKNELTKEFLSKAVLQFEEFIKKYEEATAMLKAKKDENEDIDETLQDINFAIRFHIANFANILAWNATLIEEYEIAGKLYNYSLNYHPQNIPSLLSIASLSKEGKIKNINKEAVEQNLLTIAKINEDNTFAHLGFTVFYSGFVYGPQHYYDIKWDWIIFGIPRNSPTFTEAFSKISNVNKKIFNEKAIPASKASSTLKLIKNAEEAKKHNLPEKLSDFTPDNYYTLYSLIRNKNDEISKNAKEYLIAKICRAEEKSDILSTRILIEKSIFYKDSLFLRKTTRDYISKFGYNQEVFLAALLSHSRLQDFLSQKATLEKIIHEEGENTPKWVPLMNDAISALFRNDNNNFYKNCYEATKCYKGDDVITLGYLYNLYAFSKLTIGGIKDPEKEDINFFDLIEGKIINKDLLIEADVVEYAIGSYLLQKGDFEEAIPYLIRAYNKNQYSQFYLNNLVVALTENGEYELGRNALKEHNESVQKLNFASLDTLAVCIVRANPNDAKEALEILEKSNKMINDLQIETPVEIYLHFAEIYNILDENDKAKEYLDKVLAMPLKDNMLNNDKAVLEYLKKVLK